MGVLLVPLGEVSSSRGKLGVLLAFYSRKENDSLDNAEDVMGLFRKNEGIVLYPSERNSVGMMLRHKDGNGMFLSMPRY